MAPDKKHRPEQVVNTLRQIEVAMANGNPDFANHGVETRSHSRLGWRQVTAAAARMKSQVAGSAFDSR